ncbi:MAG: hypothetical protein HGA87_04670 [Desulfobulbaceae bacterium]|nr:hypothetical protein [Desulfobulbaceae bacterium]
MGAVAPEELARLWAQDEVTTERAIGQIVQQLVTIQASLDRQAQALNQLRADVAICTTHSEESADKRKRTRRAK